MLGVGRYWHIFSIDGLVRDTIIIMIHDDVSSSNDIVIDSDVTLTFINVEVKC